MNIFNYLFPDSTQFTLSQWSVEEREKEIKLKLCSKQTPINCPGCYHPTNQIHSHYKRTLRDLPWADYSINLTYIQQIKMEKSYFR